MHESAMGDGNAGLGGGGAVHAGGGHLCNTEATRDNVKKARKHDAAV